MAQVYGLGRIALLLRVILPGALPSIFVGLRYRLGLMWLTLIVAETISASSGIGYMTMNAREFLQTDVVLLGVIIYPLLGKLSDTITRLFERAALPGTRATPAPPRRADERGRATRFALARRASPPRDGGRVDCRDRGPAERPADRVARRLQGFRPSRSPQRSRPEDRAR
jgi:hypothetical protein